MVECQQISPNFTTVETNNVRYWFSYKTCIAYQPLDGSPRVVRRNDWGPTTGKHLNYIDGGDKASRLEGDDFEARLKLLS